MYGSNYVGRENHSENYDEEFIPSLDKESEKTSKEKRLARAKIEALQERKNLEDMLFDIFDEDPS